MAEIVHFPNNTQHLLELGRNGSGKTIAGLWHVSSYDFDKMPTVMVDTKGDENIEKIGHMSGVQTIKINENPGKAGLYIVRPRPDQTEELEQFLWRIHARNNVRLYFDEGYMVDQRGALNALLTQGRSKRIPIVILSQRPAWLSRFCFSEASFFQVFSLTDQRDRLTVQQFIPKARANLETRLQPFHSIWYDVKRDQANVFSPVPPADEILETFRTKLNPRMVRI